MLYHQIWTAVNFSIYINLDIGIIDRREYNFVGLQMLSLILRVG